MILALPTRINFPWTRMARVRYREVDKTMSTEEQNLQPEQIPSFLPKLFSNPFNFTPHSEQVTAPKLTDLLFGVAAAYQLQRDVKRLRRAVPTINAASAIKI